MEIIWTKPALGDIEDIKQFIAKDSPYYAEKYTEKIITQTEKLKKFPKIGRILPEEKKENLRELIFGNYRIIYLLAENEIVIIAIAHTRRDLKNI